MQVAAEDQREVINYLRELRRLDRGLAERGGQLPDTFEVLSTRLAIVDLRLVIEEAALD